MLVAETVWLLGADDVTGRPLSTVKSKVSVAAGVTLDLVVQHAAAIQDDDALTVHQETHLDSPLLSWAADELHDQEAIRWGHAVDALYAKAWDKTADSLEAAGVLHSYTKLLRRCHRVTLASTRIDLVARARHDLDQLGAAATLTADVNYLRVLHATDALAMATNDPDLGSYTVGDEAVEALSHDCTCHRLGEAVQYLLAPGQPTQAGPTL